MNYKILLSTTFVAMGLCATAQNTPTFAITGDGDYRWMNIRQINVESGKLVKEVYKNGTTSFVMLDAATKQKVVAPANARFDAALQPTATMVAAAAYDKRHGKLFFTPMRIGELRWLDVSAGAEAPKFYTEQTKLLTTGDLMEEANHITRMDIAADGNGYAITNDGNHFIRFTTGKKTVITDLGALIDAESNKSVSIHNRCTSWGGDMVADAYGKLYIISANHNIFKIDIDSRVATHIGSISGLPAAYTTNGAAVDDNENIVVSSANSFEGFYKFSIKDLAAVKIEASDKCNASDLANGNLLFQKEVDAKRSLGVTELLPAPPINTDARVYPNPVTNNEFRVLLDNLDAGKYTIVLNDLSGRVVLNKVVNVYSKTQAEKVQITNTIGKGVYFVKLLNAAKQTVFTDRIVVQ